ncbi:IS21 family transposase, partial [Burkholderia cenocepacia]|nr:IS21 family transposase [Burkholderia cenocepacia]
LEGRRRTSLLPGHRRANQRKQPARHPVPSVTASVARRPLSFYDQVARRLAEAGRTA